MKLEFNKTSYLISIACVLLLGTIFGILYFNSTSKNETTLEYRIYEEKNVLHYNHIKYELTEEVQQYINKTAPSNCLEAIVIVDECMNYNVDICFVLAQGQQESHFGTTGTARKTNSVWNVYAYEGKSADEIDSRGKYNSPSESVRPYLDLLSRRYLVKGKTEYDMLTNYVDSAGHRYAGDKTYENTLRGLYQTIKETTKIDSLSQELKKYQIIIGN